MIPQNYDQLSAMLDDMRSKGANDTVLSKAVKEVKMKYPQNDYSKAMPKSSLVSTGIAQTKPGMLAKGVAGVGDAFAKLPSEYGSSVAKEASSGVEDIKKGIGQAGGQQGQNFVSNVEAGLTGALNVGAGASKVLLSPVMGPLGEMMGGTANSIGNIADIAEKQPLGQAINKMGQSGPMGANPATQQKIAEVKDYIAKNPLPEGLQAVLNAGMQSLNWIGAGETGEAAEAATKAVEPMAEGLKGAADAVKGEFKSLASKFKPSAVSEAEKVVDASGAIPNASKSTVKQMIRNAIKDETGLNEHTISYAVNNPDIFKKIMSGGIDKQSTIGEVTDAFKKAESELSSSGSEYNAIRKGAGTHNINPEMVDATLANNGLKTDVAGNVVEISPNSSNLSPEDMKVVQGALGDINKNPTPNAGEYLNLRQKLDDSVNWNAKVSDKAERVVKQLRGALNEDATKTTFHELGELDKKFAPQKKELDAFKKEYFQRDTQGNWVLKDNAASKIMNLTKANRTQALARLEERVPGISKKIEGLGAHEDLLQTTSGQKVGTYRKGLGGRALGALGGSIFGPAGTSAGFILGNSLVNPEKAIELIQKYGKDLYSPEAVSEVVGKIGSGEVLSKTESGMIDNVAKEVAKTPESAKAMAELQPFKGMMNPNRPEQLLKVEGDIMEEMAQSTKGEKVFSESANGEGGGSAVSTLKSTFPDWVSPEVRSRKLFDSVTNKLVDGKPIKGANERILLNDMIKEAQARLGTTPKDPNLMKIPESVSGSNPNPNPAEPTALPKADLQTEAQFGIKRNMNLPKEDLIVQDKSIAKFLNNPNKMVQDYFKKYGFNINTDQAGNLFEDVGYNRGNAEAVHEASSALTKEAWKQALQITNDSDAIIYAGGSGSGKSTAVGNMGLSDGADQAILDGNLSKMSSAMERIKEAIKAGKNAVVRYVYRDPLDAFENGVLKRYFGTKETGRVVPISAHIQNHTGSLDVIKQVAKNNMANELVLIDNSKGLGNSGIMTPEELYSLEMPKDLRPKLEAILKKHKNKMPLKDYEAFMR